MIWDNKIRNNRQNINYFSENNNNIDFNVNNEISNEFYINDKDHFNYNFFNGKENMVLDNYQSQNNKVKFLLNQ